LCYPARTVAVIYSEGLLYLTQGPGEQISVTLQLVKKQSSHLSVPFKMSNENRTVEAALCPGERPRLQFMKEAVTGALP